MTPSPTAPSDAVDHGFDVLVASTQQVARVEPGQSIVEALEGIGVVVPTSCQSGLCGTCRVRYLDGEVDHQDCILEDHERADWMTICVSRARSRRLVLDL